MRASISASDRSTTLLVAWAASVVAACAPGESERPDPPPFDWIIDGGLVYDGTGAEPYSADVGLIGERIVEIGDLTGRPAARRVDADGLALMPGAIDIHNHAIRANRARSGLLRWPEAENLIRQGVTTVIGGPDGWSMVPLEANFDALDEAGPRSVNFGTFLGLGAVREAVIGDANREASAGELNAMRAIVDEAMHQGGYGLSVGLTYAPGSFATTDELVALSEVAARHDGIYIAHMRSEGRRVLEAIDETIEIAERAGIAVQITHHKVMGQAMWGRAGETLKRVRRARARGLDVTSDQYPYPASSTGLTAIFPNRALDGGRDALIRRMDDPGERAALREAMIGHLDSRVGNDLARVQLANCAFDPDLNGSTLADVLRSRDCDVSLGSAADLVMELQRAGGCIAVYHAMHEADVRAILLAPTTMVASDGGVVVPGFGVPHPRNYGAFARVLGHYVRELELLPLTVAVHKMTGMPAERLGLTDRGRLREGGIADLVVFDPATIGSTATFTEPHRYADGVSHVFVAGEPVLLDGTMTGSRPGRILRKRQ